MLDVTLQPLLTTVVGSYPSAGLPPRRAIQRAVEQQIVAGIDLISDGQMRGDMVGAFASRIPGFEQAADGVWEVVDALDLPDAPIGVADFAFARALAAGRAEVKGIVTGPVTLALACRVASRAPYTGPDDPVLVLRLSEILAREVAAVVAAGASVVQIDEPALGRALGERVSPELANDALCALAAIPRLPVLHVCGDIRTISSELLVLPFEALDIENVGFDNLAAMDADELEYSSVRLSIGCLDSRTDELEPVETIRERVRAALDRLPADRLWISPDCGFGLRSPEAAARKLANMVAAVADLRADL